MPNWTILAVISIISIISIAVLGIALLVSRGRATRRSRTSEVRSETELDYKARDDRTPNLEETLKVYSFHQRGILALDDDRPGPVGGQGGPERAPGRDSLAEAS